MDSRGAGRLQDFLDSRYRVVGGATGKEDLRFVGVAPIGTEDANSDVVETLNAVNEAVSAAARVRNGGGEGGALAESVYLSDSPNNQVARLRFFEVVGDVVVLVDPTIGVLTHDTSVPNKLRRS